ncbi:hypothetical protein M5J14_19160 [Lysinibacillus sp. OL1_EC]|uniref:hypothetical protein n=1 Tax=unclassified Lysinibacillus TaxID=2636778 RepID=UPI00187D29FD|nr:MULTISPECIES: hypothetical protein [unclassified Lysinibacillus]MCM0626620.1 hypothetical protein [Lysinibacillus sp. OL1_EC]
MKIIRSYASSDKAVNASHILRQLIELELEKKVNTNAINPPASHKKINHGGDYV